ncbi:hypothetical protein L0128_22665, partial [candidate division KSB1 bacterium]|nr:hypothetical protein [candidate division KSB1 bacterium]
AAVAFLEINFAGLKLRIRSVSPAASSKGKRRRHCVSDSDQARDKKWRIHSKKPGNPGMAIQKMMRSVFAWNLIRASIVLWRVAATPSPACGRGLG